MANPLLATKIFIPPPTKNLINRPRLQETLDTCLLPTCRLALISAPAGFGKTTTASAWLQNAKTNSEVLTVAWLSLDARDNDPILFWLYACKALNAQNRSIGSAALTLLPTSQVAELDPILAMLVNDLSETTTPIVLVLDDFHFIEAPIILDSIHFLLSQAPPNFHLILLTRIDPPLPLARMRSLNQVLEIRQADLRFSQDETDTFIHTGMGLRLPSKAVNTLHQKTEGWAAGLQMACLAIQAQSARDQRLDNNFQSAEAFIDGFSGSNRFILDYLVEEVIKRQTPGVQKFLTKTSILDRLCSSLCDAILQESLPGERMVSQQVIDYLEKNNLFIISLDEDRCWYRYHPLFADLLRKSLAQESAEQIQELHQRASQWFRKNEMPYQAVEHAFLAQNQALAALILDEHLETIFGQGNHTWLLQWIQKLDPEQLRMFPRLAIFMAAILAFHGRLSEAEKWLHTVETIGTIPDVSSISENWLKGRISAVHALIAAGRGDFQVTRQYGQMALKILTGENDMLWRAMLMIALSNVYLAEGDLPATRQLLTDAVAVGRRSKHIFFTIDATSKLLMILWLQGNLREAVEVCQSGLKYIEDNGLVQVWVAGMVYLGWGFILCERYQLAEAEEYIQRGIRLCQQGSNRWVMAWAYQIRLLLYLIQQDWALAEKTVSEAEQYLMDYEIPDWIATPFFGLKVLLWIRLGRLEDAEKILHERGVHPDCELKAPYQMDYQAMIQLFLINGAYDSALRFLDRIIPWIEATQQDGWLIATRLMQALVFEAQGNMEQALLSLKVALDLAEPEGYVQVFLNKGEGRLRLLRLAVQNEIHANYARQLLSAVGSEAKAQLSKAKKEKANSPLTERELTVLRLITDGLTNKEIARQLCVSLRTVKYFTTSIYTKLDVEGRVQAVTRAKSLGLVP